MAALPDLLYYDVGDVQFGFRHLLDFVPFLVLLAALALRSRRYAITYFVGYFNVFCGFVWMFAYRALYMH